MWMASVPKEHAEKEQVEERHCMEKEADVPTGEFENKQSDAETWRGRGLRETDSPGLSTHMTS